MICSIDKDAPNCSKGEPVQFVAENACFDASLSTDGLTDEGTIICTWCDLGVVVVFWSKSSQLACFGVILCSLCEWADVVET
mmetsp:Transcript_21208/g.24877  ORF Transcript_21208/g.24877 Transcript_21208/m.24877 type:complete len:82 (+) Transcript_21208:442-687(+)